MSLCKRVVAMLHKILYILCALQSATRILSAERQTILEIHNISCLKYTERIKSFECEFRKYALSHYGLSGRVMFNRNLDRNCRVRVWFDIIPKSSKQVMHVLDIKLNICSMLQHMTGNGLLKTILIEATRASNLPTSCPIKGNILYRMDNFTVTNDYFPSFMPFLNFIYTVEFYESNKLFGKWQVFGSTMGKSK